MFYLQESVDKVRNWKQQLEISPPDSISGQEEVKENCRADANRYRNRNSSLRDAVYDRDMVEDQHYSPVKRSLAEEQYEDMKRQTVEDSYVPITKRFKAELRRWWINSLLVLRENE